MDEAEARAALQASIPGFPPQVTWKTLQAWMLLLAATPAASSMTEHLVEALRLQSAFLTPQLIRRELAIIFAALVDPSFPGEGQPMT